MIELLHVMVITLYRLYDAVIYFLNWDLNLFVLICLSEF